MIHQPFLVEASRKNAYPNIKSLPKMLATMASIFFLFKAFCDFPAEPQSFFVIKSIQVMRMSVIFHIEGKTIRNIKEEAKQTMALMEAKKCPRKYRAKNLRRDGKNFFLAHSVKEVLRSISYEPLKATPADIEKAVTDIFDANRDKFLLDREREAEAERMVKLISRWLEWEHVRNDWKLLACEEKVTVPFAGKDIDVRIDALVMRKSIINGQEYIEAIRFDYKSPFLTMRGRSEDTRTDKNADLLLLRLAGEQVADQLGYPKAKYPTYPVFCHLKGKSDTAKQIQDQFEARAGDNVITHEFLAQEIKDLETEFSAILASSAPCGDPDTCKNCAYNDHCNGDFTPHKLEEEEEVPIRTMNEVHLTPNQQTFIDSPAAFQRANACAGSGKTTVVALRVIALLESGVSPEKILMITFTRKAAEEMRERIIGYAKGDALKDEELPVEDVHVETFNSWGQTLIEANYQQLGFTKPPAPVDDVTKKDIIIKLIDTYPPLHMDNRNPVMNTVSSEGVITALVKIFDELKSMHASCENDVNKLANRNVRSIDVPQIWTMYEEYNKALIAANMLDYEDQLRLLLDLNKNGLFSTLGYEHVIVDEFQDSDPNQIEILVQLAQACKPTLQSLVVVGDELQSIYGFRNASPDNLTQFDQYFPGMVDVTLADNFRSETPIIALANHMTKCIARIPKQIISHSTVPGVAPVPMEMKDQKQEDELFTKQIQKLLKNGTKPSDIAVIAATRAELIHFQHVFDAAGIPTVLRVPKVVGDEPLVKAIIALASFIKNDHNRIDLALYAKAMGEDPFDEAMLDKNADAIKQLFDNCKTEEKKIGTFFSLIAPLREDYIADSFATTMESRGFHTLKDYLDYCIKYREYDIKEMASTSREKSDCVSLITVHSAKGLEWDTVLLSMKRFRYSTEAERLLYVAVTRAKSRLLITYTDKQVPFKRLLYP